MFAKSGNGAQIAWSVLSLETRVVRDSGHASTLQDCLVQAGEGEDVLIGQALPAGTTVLPDGAILVAVSQGPAPTSADVKAAAGRLLSYTDWMVVRAAEDPDRPVPTDILAARAQIRDRAAAIERMNPIPADFRDPKYWT